MTAIRTCPPSCVSQVERVLDLMDINWLRLSSGARKNAFNNLFCQDANFKTMLCAAAAAAACNPMPASVFSNPGLWVLACL